MAGVETLGVEENATTGDDAMKEFMEDSSAIL